MECESISTYRPFTHEGPPMQNLIGDMSFEEHLENANNQFKIIEENKNSDEVKIARERIVEHLNKAYESIFAIYKSKSSLNTLESFALAEIFCLYSRTFYDSNKLICFKFVEKGIELILATLQIWATHPDYLRDFSSLESLKNSLYSQNFIPNLSFLPWLNDPNFLSFCNDPRESISYSQGLLFSLLLSLMGSIYEGLPENKTPSHLASLQSLHHSAKNIFRAVEEHEKKCKELFISNLKKLEKQAFEKAFRNLLNQQKNI